MYYWPPLECCAMLLAKSILQSQQEFEDLSKSIDIKAA